jgi:hypothetical protein
MFTSAKSKIKVFVAFVMAISAEIESAVISGDVSGLKLKLLSNEKAEGGLNFVVEMVGICIAVALVLVPIGLYFLNTANTSGFPAAQVAAVSSIGVIIIAAIVLHVLKML